MQASRISYQGMFPSIHRLPINQPSIKNKVENANENIAKKYWLNGTVPEQTMGTPLPPQN